MIKRALYYPLRPETLTAGLLFYGVLGLLFASYKFSASTEAGLLNMWLAFSIFAVVVYTGLLFDYGMQILCATSDGRQQPPVFSGNLTSIADGARRCLRVIVLLALFAAAARQLHSFGWEEAEWTVWIIVFLLMPALIINNAVYGRVLTMLNPAALWTTMRNLGWISVPVLALQTFIVALAWISLTGSTGLFLLLFPLVLYCYFMFSHALGLRVAAKKSEFFRQVDFKADRAQTKSISDNLAELNRELSEAYEWLRNAQPSRVHEKLDALLQRSDWDNFEQLFGYTSQWFDKGPAVHLCRLYLDKQMTLSSKPMRAFELAQWALARDPEFTVTMAGNLRILAEHAVTAAQYRTVLHLVENYLRAHPDSQQRVELVNLALGVAGEKLKDEALYLRLKSIL